MAKKLLIVTTVPDTFEYILKGQPKFLSENFSVSIASSNSPLLKSFADKEGVNFHSINMKRGISPLHDLISVFNMFILMVKLKPDLVHSYTPKAALICAIAGFFARIPIRIHTFTGLLFPTASGFKRILLKSLDRLVCLLNTHVVPEGNGVLNELKNVTNKSLKIIGYGNIAGVDLDYFDPCNSDVQYKASNLRLENSFFDYITYCYVGRLNKDKGLDELCSAFIKTNENYPCKLIIVGDVDHENPISSSTLNTLKSHPSICYCGFQEDVRPFIVASDVLVLPSYREGFPNVVLQAGALAKPCLVTDVAGSNEIIVDNFNGWIVSPRNIDQLTEKMKSIQCIGVSELLAMGSASRDNVISKFDRKFYQQKLLDFYKRVSHEAII